MLSSAKLDMSDFSINKKKTSIKILTDRGPWLVSKGLPLVSLAQSLYEEPIFVLCSRKLK